MLGLNGRLGSSKLAKKLLARLQSTGSADAQAIRIPKRIERGPTDILKALASTVERDPTAAHYKYHDDPFFIPTSNVAKRTLALSQEAGRKAAMYIRQEQAALFQHREADPVIEDFLPRAVYDENTPVSLEVLRRAIQDGRMTDAVTIYKLLKEENIDVPTKQSFLEMLCYCNDQEPMSDEFNEERWFRRSIQTVKPKWKTNDLLEKIFESLKDQDSSIAAPAYNAMICGTAKYLQVDRAWTLYRECMQKGLPIYVRSYNSILRLVQFTKDSGEERKHLMLDVLSGMAKEKVRPNVGTLNAALQISTMLRSPHPGREMALTVYKEFTNAGVEPCLGSYYYLLTVFCRNNGPKSEILIDILDKLDGKNCEIKDPQDLLFFVKAMDIARNHMVNVHVAHRIHKLLLTGNNYNMIGENYMESVYYRHYLTLMVQTEPLKKFMALYDTLVPNIYTPEPDVMDEILQAIEINGADAACDLLPRIWSQMVMFELAQREPLLVRVLQIMHTSCRPPAESPANQQFADIAWAIWNRIEGQRADRLTRLTWSAEMLGQVAVLSIRGGYFERMLATLSYIIDREGTFPGVLTKENLETFLDACIENGHAPAAVSVVEYAANNGFSEAGQMGYKVVHTLSLNAAEENKLVNLVGKDVLQLYLG